MDKLASPKVSIIVTCYNLGEFLEEAVVSAVNVNYSNFEIIIVNDGSFQQKTLEVLKELENQYANDSRVVFIHQENRGLSAARNVGIAQSTGEYILPLDADNKLRPDYLTKATSVMENDSTIGVVYAHAQRFGELSDLWEFKAFDIYDLLQDNQVEACSVFRRKVWEDCRGFDETLFKIGYEDWDLWLGVYEKGWKFHLLTEVLFDYRVRKDSMVTFCSTPANWKVLTKNLRTKHGALYHKYWPRDYFAKEHQLTKTECLIEELRAQNSATKASEAALRRRAVELEDKIVALENLAKKQKEISREVGPVEKLYMSLKETRSFKALKYLVKGLVKDRAI